MLSLSCLPQRIQDFLIHLTVCNMESKESRHNHLQSHFAQKYQLSEKNSLQRRESNTIQTHREHSLVYFLAFFFSGDVPANIVAIRNVLISQIWVEVMLKWKFRNIRLIPYLILVPCNIARWLGCKHYHDEFQFLPYLMQKKYTGLITINPLASCVLHLVEYANEWMFACAFVSEMHGITTDFVRLCLQMVYLKSAVLLNPQSFLHQALPP